MKKNLFAILGILAVLGTMLLSAAALADTAWNEEPAVLEFRKKSFEGGQMLPVYSGPGYEYLRPTGYAKVSTNDTIWMAGRKGNWALVMYQKNSGGFRTGWIDASKLQYKLGGRSVHLTNRYAKTRRACQLTDDPKNRSYTLTKLQSGESVTYLASYYDHIEWAYIEVWAGTPVCGFVPMEDIELR